MGETRLYIDTDNALGSPRGDVDDGFAVSALLLSGTAVAAVSSVAGNTSEARAFQNNGTLAGLCGYEGPLLHGGAEAARFLSAAAGPLRVLALGPLTNVAAGLEQGARPAEIVIVGGNAASHGRWPPLWPFEFNLFLDRPAVHAVFESKAPLTFVTLDVAGRMLVRKADLEALPGALGEHLRRGSRRWFRRALLLRASRWIRLWDLAAALYALEPGLFRLVESRARLHRSGWIEFGAGERPVRLVRGFDRDALWARFVDLLSRPRHGNAQAPLQAPRRD
jgi:inosine-uridine nucleoside N-ribohydrolase